MAINACNTLYSQSLALKIMAEGCLVLSGEHGGTLPEVPGGTKEPTISETIECFQLDVMSNESRFTLPWSAISTTSLLVTIDGVKQHADSFSINIGDSVTVLEFSENLVEGQRLEVYGFQTLTPSRLGLFTRVAPGGQRDFGLPWYATNTASLIVTLDGVIQHIGAYDLYYPADGQSAIRFVEDIPVGVEIEVFGLRGYPNNTFSVANYVADGATADFVVPWSAIGSKIILTLDGIKQGRQTFEVIPQTDGSTIFRLNEIPANQTEVEILGITFESNVDDTDGCACAMAAFYITEDGARNLKELRRTKTGYELHMRRMRGDDDIIVTENADTVDFALSQALKNQINAIPDVPSISAADDIRIDVDVNGDLVIGRDITAPTQLAVSNAGNGYQLVNQDGDIRTLRTGPGLCMRVVNDVIEISNRLTGGHVSVSTSAYTADPLDGVISVTQPNTVITLPNMMIADAGKQLTIKDVAGTGNITINANQPIDGQVSLTLTQPYASVTLYHNGTGWSIINMYKD